jgi:methylglutaconyl-CoA hydratase
MIDVQIDNAVCYIRLNRPDKRNALNREMVELLQKAFVKKSNDNNVKVIVLSGEGDVFSAGADLEALKNLQTATFSENKQDSATLASLFETMYRCPKPIIGAINGHAIAGGCGLVSLCDITVAKVDAKFGYTETAIGFVPALVARFLIKKVGETHARRLLLSAEIIGAEEAARIGLITEVTAASDDAFAQRLHYWIDRFTTKVSPQAVAQTKELLRTTSDLGWSDALHHAVEINAKARESDDCKRGISAFLNKEKIIW